LNGSRNKERATAVLAKRTNLGNLNEVNTWAGGPVTSASKVLPQRTQPAEAAELNAILIPTLSPASGEREQRDRVLILLHRNLL
jgi:hypothetical protein